MTKKEALANMYITLKKEFDGDEFNSNLNCNKVCYLKSQFKAYQLEDKIEAVKRAIADKKLRLKKEAFYETEAGKIYKKNIEDRMNLLISVRKSLIRSVEDFVQTYLDKNLGDGWICQFSHGYDDCRMTIGLKAVNPEYIEKNFTFEFGHEFDIYWDKDYFGKGKRFEMSYGTLGAFDLENNKLRPKYLLGMGKFCSDTSFITKLSNEFDEVNTKLMEIGKSIDELNKKYENPEM